MRVIAYNILEREKELLTIANAKIHDFTFISNPLCVETLPFVKGKEVVVVSHRDVLDRQILEGLKDLGVKSVITRSASVAHIDLDCAGRLQMHVANTPLEDPGGEEVARQTIQNLNNWMAGGCAGNACQCRMECTNKSIKRPSL